MRKQRRQCVGGPKDGQTVAILHGARFLDMSTGSVYVLRGNVWVYDGPIGGGKI